MSDREALIRAIHHAIDDDAPRLIMADWLDEHGDSERAALIRWMIRVPSYTFHWSRRAKMGRHVHQEAIKAIRGLRPALTSFCREDLASRPDIERVVIRRGFIESIVIAADALIAQAGELFLLHPVQTVEVSDLSPGWIFDPEEHFRRPLDYFGHVEVYLVQSDFGWMRWPVALFPEMCDRPSLQYRTREEALDDLARHAAAFGRRMAGIRKEPPPLPAWVKKGPKRAMPTGPTFGKVGGEVGAFALAQATATAAAIE